MPILAPVVVSRIAHGQLSLRRSAATAAAVDDLDLSTIPRSVTTIQVVPLPSTAAPPPVLSTQLTLRGLLQSESVQTIQNNLAVLAEFAHHLPRDISATTASVGDDELLIMGKLLRDVSVSLEKIGSLRHQGDDDDPVCLPGIADKYVPVRPVSFGAKRRRREKMKLKLAHKCHNCSRLETPQWRPGPDGPKTLCNVCGLIYTKRQQRHAEHVTRSSRE